MNWRALTKEELEYQYNPRLTVPDCEDYFSFYRQESEQARAGLPCRLDIRYGEGEKATLDWYGDHLAAPLHVFFHGGYWRSQDKRDYAFVARDLVGAGFNVAIVNYDLCPTVDVQSINRQCIESIEYLLQQAPGPGFDPAELSISGHSAGGQIVTAVLHHDWAADQGYELSLKAAVAISGVFELEPVSHTSINEDLKLTSVSAKSCSPQLTTRFINSPLWVCVGAAESQEFRLQSENYFNRHCLKQNHDRFDALARSNHFSVLPTLFTKGNGEFDALVQFLQSPGA